MVAFASGAAGALALPPFGLWPFLAVFAVLLHVLREAEGARRAFALGWWFGFGHFLAGLYWIAIAFFTDAERFGALAVPAVVLLCAGLALFTGLATWLARLRRFASPAAGALALALAWIAAEGLRSTLFSGFPWNLVGYAWSGTPVAQLAAFGSVYGLGVLAVLAGALPAALLERGRAGWPPALAAALLVGAAFAGGALRLTGAEVGTVPDVRLRLVQGNVAQELKWDPELRAHWFRRHLDLTAAGQDGVTHVVWPESATPYALEDDPSARAYIADVVPDGGLLVTGGNRYDFESEPPRAWNSLFVLDEEGAIRAVYDKRLLVPFGEYVPLRSFLRPLGLERLAHGTIDFRPGPGVVTIDLPGLPAFSPLICYESIFAGLVADDEERPAWLLNVTNDAWFGRSSGPYQHLAMARMRAIEEGLPLVRAANSGISAVFDPFGRPLARLGLNETGVLDAALPRPLAAGTVFSAYGFAPLIFLLCLVGLVTATLEWRAVRTPKG